MPLLKKIESFWRTLFRRQELDRELREELESYIDEMTSRKVMPGVDFRTARRQVLVSTGSVAGICDEVRTQRVGSIVESSVRDTAYALKALCRTPGFAVVTILSLALGIGGTTAVFTLMDPLVLRPLPVSEPGRLVSFQPLRMDVRALLPDIAEEVVRRFLGENPTYAELDALAARSNVFSSTFDYSPASSNFKLRADEGDGRAGEIPVVVAQASSGFFPTLGIELSLGRPFLESDFEPGQPSVGVVSDAFWRNRLGRDPDVIGRTVTLIQSPQISRIESQLTIIGVAAEGFDGIEPGTLVDLWRPSGRIPGGLVIPNGPRALSWWTGGYGAARLRPGVTLDEARVQINTIYQQLLAGWAAQYGSDWTASQIEQFRNQTMDLRPAAQGWTRIWSQLGQSLIVLMAGVSCLLLIGCANVGALLMARGEGRREELTVRMALGSSRGRLLRQLLTESVAIAAAGGLAGLGVAYITVRLLLLYAPEGANLAQSVGPNLRILFFTVGATCLSVILFGLVPALRTTRLDLSPGLRGTKTADGSVPMSRWKAGRVLVASQLALSLVLLVGAGLLVETLQNLRQIETGFDKQSVVRFELDRQTLPSPELVDQLEGVAGIDSATVSTDVGILGGHGGEIPVVADGESVEPGQERTAIPIVVGQRFFETMGIRLLAGRTLQPEDAARAGEVAVVSETMARDLFGDENPVGRRFYSRAPEGLLGLPAIGGQGVEIVGVVEDVVHQNLRESPQASVYFPLPPSARPDLFNFVVRTSLGPARAASAIRSMIATFDADVQVARIQTMDGIVEATLAEERFMAYLAQTFALLAVALATIGLYGTLSFAIAQRTREVGIRMALGARAQDVVRQLIVEAGWTVGLGLTLGLGATLLATQAISTFLFGVTPTDTFTIVSAALILTAGCVVAAWLPARRASHVSPLVALRYD